MQRPRARFALLLCLLGFAAVESAAAATRQELNAYVSDALKKLYDESPAARDLATQARGVLVFPRVWKGGIGLGAEVGEGALRIGGSTADYYLLTGGSMGIQLGLQRKSVVILFMDGASLQKFRASEGWKAGVDGSVAIASLGAGGGIDTNTGQ